MRPTKPPRLLAVLALGGILFAFASAQSAQAQIKIVPLSAEKVDKLGEFIQSTNNDPAKKATIKEADKAFTIDAMAGNGSVNADFDSKYPEAVALYKAAGYTPDDFLAMIMSMTVASKHSIRGTSDRAQAKANVEFYHANKDKVDQVLAVWGK